MAGTVETHDRQSGQPRPAARRGTLRVYLGAAPGVGKTVAMLGEGRRRAERGTDVVVAVVEDHGRAFTAAQLPGLEVIPRRTVSHRGVQLTDMDTAAVVARLPEVALVDELAHRNAPGTAHERRWQDVEELLDAGIDVISTVNVQHLESLNDVVTSITGVVQPETVPDAVVRSAEQVELVDMTPQALRRRMAHGHVYPPERVDTALANFFREGNLTALRELALLWVADRVDEGLAKYRAQHGIRQTWAARERVVVALPGGPEGAMLLRRGARIVGRGSGRDLMAVHVVRSDGSVGTPTTEIDHQRRLAESLGGTLHVVVGDDMAAAVLDFARGVNASQIVVGVSRHGRFTRLFRPSTSGAIVDGSGDIDVHVVTHPKSGHRRGPRWPAFRPRWPWAWTASLVVPLLLTAALVGVRGSMNLSTVLLILLLGVLTTSLIGGVLAAAVSAVIAGLLANFVFTPPTGSWTIAEPQNIFALVAFVVVAVTVAALVDAVRRRAVEAARRTTAAQLLAAVAVRSAHAADPLAEILEQTRVAFGMNSVQLVRTGAHPEVLAAAGESGMAPTAGATGAPAEAETLVDAGTSMSMVLRGRRLPAEDTELVEVIAGQAAAAVERNTLAGQARQTERLRQTDAVRTALLAAVSHDLRTPLSTIKASVSSLRDVTVDYSAEDRAELLAATDEAADQLDSLLSNLLDLSRLQTGVLVPVPRRVSVDEVVNQARIGLPPGRIRDDIGDDLPLLVTDAGLLERVMANLLSNALRHTGSDVRVLAGVVADRMEIRVVDHGPGVPEGQREEMFRAFQRLGDAPRGAGVGLGLAVARGLAEAVGATIEVDDTPGGGLTMVLSVPMTAPEPAAGAPAVGETSGGQ